METIHGFDIPKRELTEEEKNRFMTEERISEFHTTAGEDLVDQLGWMIDIKTLGEFFKSKYPDLSSELNEIIEDKHGEPLNIMEVMASSFIDDRNDEIFYRDLCEFLNSDIEGALGWRQEFNQVMIQVTEYRGD